jgi:hypothetical protein
VCRPDLLLMHAWRKEVFVSTGRADMKHREVSEMPSGNWKTRDVSSSSSWTKFKTGRSVMSVAVGRSLKLEDL